uniref:fibrosin-1-like protein isoform X2 n=1 Tax=Oncorhynchus gorbuscha TaxID=8017 RepID=UPI001EAE894A|nr:fibrosin-1-like protein isoform X2 [Oncorhynchus gorbuscha]
MDGKLKQSRRSRSKRERVRRREALGKDARSPKPSSCSDREQSPGRDLVSQNGKKSPHSTPSARTSRPPRRKRRESSSQEEDIIDEFAIASFVSLDCLEKKTGALKSQERKEKEKERWREEKQQETVVKRQKEKEEEEEENVMPTSLDPLENGFINHAQREQERMNDRLLKKTYSKKNKQIKALQVRPVKLDEVGAMQEFNRPNRSISKEHLSESSTHSLSGRGYSCDSESDVDDKVSDVGSEKLFSPTTPKGVSTNENSESKTVSSAKVSGLQRSQEQSNEVPFAPPVSSPTPASPPSGSPAPAATAAGPPQPLPKAQLTTPPPLLIKRESDRVPPIPRFPTPPLLRAQPHPLQEHRVPVSLPPPQHQHHARPLINHQVHQHHPLHYNSLHDISGDSAGLPKHHHLPPSPHHLPPLPTTCPPLPTT